MQNRIVKALEAAGRMTTRELASRLHADREQIYRICRRLEEDGRLTSELIRAAGKSIFFFPMTKEVVTSDSYEHIENLNAALLDTVRAYALPQEQTKLVSALELQFERIAEQVGPAKQAVVEEFAEEVLVAAASATKRGEVTSHLGIRPMRPPSRVWALGRQLGLI